MEGLTTQLAGLRLESPLVSASGIYGPDSEQLAAGWPWMGAAVLKSISLHPRSGNPEPRIHETRAGMLNSVGIPNAGLEVFLAQDLPKLPALKVPVIASIMGTEIGEYVTCADALTARDEIHALELNVSCPNLEKGGIEFGCDTGVLEELTRRVKPVMHGKPLIVKLTPNVTEIAAIAKAAINGGADALCILNTLRGMAIDVETQKPILGNTFGGLSGIGIHPVAVYAVYKSYTAVCRAARIPIIGLGGVTNASEAIELILAGATCVGIGTAMFRRPGIFAEVAAGLQAYLANKKEKSIVDLVGRAAA